MNSPSDPTACGNRSSCCACRGPVGLFVTVAAVWLLQVPFLLVAVPRFVERANDLGVALPAVTRSVVDASALVSGECACAGVYGPVAVGAVLTVILALSAGLLRFGGKPGRALTVLIALVGSALLAVEVCSILLPSLSMSRAITPAQSTP